MAGFLYYIPTRRAADIDAAALAAAGVGYAFEPESRIAKVDVSRGPGDELAEGVIVCDERSAGRRGVGLYADAQTWRKIPNADAWCGYWVDDPPSPADVARTIVIPGRLVLLGDGREWLIPIARQVREVPTGPEPDAIAIPAAVCALPSITDVDDTGRWVVGGLRPEYARLWAIACAWWDACLVGVFSSDGGDRVTVEFADTTESALIALRTNYRVDRIEVVALGLFDAKTTAQVLNALCDLEAATAILKKNVAGRRDPCNSKAG